MIISFWGALSNVSIWDFSILYAKAKNKCLGQELLNQVLARYKNTVIPAVLYHNLNGKVVNVNWNQPASQ